MDNLFAKDKALDSREVAMMVGKEHKNILADIRGYVKIMEDSAELNFQPGSVSVISASEFFVASEYLDANNQIRPCYMVTRKGCEFIANKLTGRKGTLFTAAYINRFHEMETATAHKPISTAKEQGAGETASLLKVVIKEMHLNNAPQSAIMRYIHTTLEQFGLPSIPEQEFVQQSHEWLTLLGKDAV